VLFNIQYPSRKERRQLVILLLLLISFVIFYLAGLINSGLKYLLSDFSLISNEIKIDMFGVIIAPIVEETLKFLGYSIIFLYAFNDKFRLGYWDKFEFADDYLGIAFVFSVGIFGFSEGIAKNIVFNPLCLVSFVLLNIFIHITYSIYPFILGRSYNNQFLFFLPIAILLHSVHNFILTSLWNNKWVTFTMVTIFLLPVLFVIRTKVLSFINKYSPFKINNSQIVIIFSVIYLSIFLCCLLAFN